MLFAYGIEAHAHCETRLLRVAQFDVQDFVPVLRALNLIRIGRFDLKIRDLLEKRVVRDRYP